MIGVLGSINLDFVATSSRLPNEGETIPGNGFKVSPGGKGANQALASRRGGSTVLMAGAVGKDEHGGRAIAALEDDDVDLSSVRKSDLGTGIASIFVSAAGENMIISVPGANAIVSCSDADTLLARMHPGDWLLLQLEIPEETVSHALARARLLGIKTLLNTAPFTPRAVELSRLADLVVMNESEMGEAIRMVELQPNDMVGLYEKLYGGREALLVVTKGGDGACAFNGRSLVSVPALAIKPIDTVGAGDTFVGYLAASLDVGLDIENSLRCAAVAGSLACLKEGAQSGIPLLNEVRLAAEN